MERVVLCQNSNTQRVSVQINDDGSVLISKDWRRTSEEEWVQGKGVSIPQKSLSSLSELLSITDETQLNNLLSKYQSAKEAARYGYGSTTYPNSGDNKNSCGGNSEDTHNRN